MTQLSPEQWRILDYLYQHKLHTVRPKLAHVCKSQKISNDDVIDLIARGYVIPVLGDQELPAVTGRLPRLFQSAVAAAIRLRLSLPGLVTVLDDPGNQIRYTLGQYGRPISLAKLFDDGNTVAVDDVADMQRRGLVSVSLPEVAEFEVTASLLLLGDFFMVTLTPKGREYLPL